MVLLVDANTFIPVDSVPNTTLTSLDAGVTRRLSGKASQASLSLTTLYLIIDGVLVVLSALAAFPLLRLRRWSRRFEQRQRRRSQCIRLGLRLTWDIAWPVVLLLGVFFFVTNSSGATW